jgi:hypothetical protein
MPTCPGCRRRVAHDDLAMHERYCPHIWAERTEEVEHADRWGLHIARSVRSLDARLADVDSTGRLATRVERLERELDDRGE